ncbi:hypothetical protein V8G54_021037 [Vigna mungo]|uniref:Uncharacterized protein n=1 Tax=Vigna mungo TaxID=3915 RepID=A0AAQ3NDM1_VIGMU
MRCFFALFLGLIRASPPFDQWLGLLSFVSSTLGSFSSVHSTLGLLLLRSQCVKAPSLPFHQCVRCLRRFSFNLTCTSLLAPSVHSRFSFVSGLPFSGFTFLLPSSLLGFEPIVTRFRQTLRKRECKCSRGEKGSCRESEVKGLIGSVRLEKGLGVNEIYRCCAYPTSKLWKVICLKKPLQCFTPPILLNLSYMCEALAYYNALFSWTMAQSFYCADLYD